VSRRRLRPRAARSRGERAFDEIREAFDVTLTADANMAAMMSVD
jgi:hypothetical protein